MAISVKDLKEQVVTPTLERMGACSPAAVKLMMATAAAESGLKSLVQVRGPALGLWQMEPWVHDDNWDHFLIYRPKELSQAVMNDGPQRASRMVYDLSYACAMARCHYLRQPARLPDADDLDGMAAYWKKWYNTELGKGTVEHFIRMYNYHLRRQI